MSLLLSIFFLGGLCFLGLSNKDTFSQSVKAISEKVCTDQITTQGQLQADINSIEIAMKENFRHKVIAKDIYGLGLMAMNKNVVGNSEYIKDDAGIMQLICEPISHNNYLSGLSELSKTLQNSETPFIYINLPDRGKNFSVADSFCYFGKKYDDITSELKNLNIDVLDIDKEIIETSQIHYDDFFFRTDIHLYTESEFKIANLITNHLATEYSLFFPYTDTVFDQNMYEWTPHSFYGNTCGSSGSFFAGTDTFQTFTPLFETQLKLTIPLANIVKEGTFNDVMTNQYIDNGENIYWVTNYGHFTEPIYKYDNALCSEGPRLLFICDSLFMRTFTFLAMNSSHITVVDPRFFNGIDWVTECLNVEKYDAVIIGDSGFLNNMPFCQGDNIFDAEILSHNAPSTVNHADSYTIDITVKNTGNTLWTEENGIRLCIWQDGVDYGYRVTLPENETVEPGDEHTFSLTGFVLPELPSTNLEFQMVREGITYFGEKEAVNISAEE